MLSAVEEQRLFSIIINFVFILALSFNLSQPIQSVLSYMCIYTIVHKYNNIYQLKGILSGKLF